MHRKEIVDTIEYLSISFFIMSNPTLSPKFEKVNTPIQNAERNEQAIIQDVQKRLEAQKNAILWSPTIDDAFLKDKYLLEVTSKIQNLVLDKSAFSINQSDIADDGEVVLYYTASDWKVYQSNPITDNLDTAQAVKDVMGTTLEWIGKQKMELLKKAGNKVTDAWLLADLQLYTSDPVAFLKAFVDNNKTILQMNDQIINEINSVKKEVLQSLWSVQDLENEVTAFDGDAARYAHIKYKLEQAKKLREWQVNWKKWVELTKLQAEINRLDTLITKTLPGKYVDQVTAKYIAPNTPKTDKDPHVLRDVEHVLSVITELLKNNALSPQEKHALEQKEKDLQNVKEQFEITTEEKEAIRLQERYDTAIEALTKNLRTMSLDRINVQKVEYDKQKWELQKWYDKIDLKSGNVWEPTSSWLVDSKARFEWLENVFAAYQARKPVYDEYKSLEAQRNQILARGELKENGQPKERSDRKELKAIDEQLKVKGKQLEPLHAAVNKAEEDVGVLPSVPYSSNWASGIAGWEEKQDKKNTASEAAYKTPENKVAWFDDIPEKEKVQLVDKYFGKQATMLWMDRWKMRCACNPRHQEFLIAYQKIALQDFMEWNRARNLTQVVKERTKLNDAELGSVRSFRVLKKKLKDQRDNEKDKYEYAKDMIGCLFEAAYYEQFNKKTLWLVEAMQANKAWMPNAMQPVPSFACSCEDTMIQIMSNHTWTEEGMGLRECGCELLSGIPGINAEGEMMKILSKNKVYKKMMKYIDPSCLRNKQWASVYPYFYPSNLPWTSADRPDMSSNTVSVYNKQTQKYEVIWNINDVDWWLDLYVQQSLSTNLDPQDLEAKKEIRDKWLALKLIHWWFDATYDLEWALQKMKYNEKTLTPEQQKSIMDTLLQDAITKDDDVIYNIRQSYNDQLNLYWVEKEKMSGPIPNKDVNSIPEDVKHRILSSAASRALEHSFPTTSGWHPRIELCLQKIYGGWRDQHNFVNSSNEVVWRNIARIMNDRKKDPNYALSAMWWKDIVWSKEQFIDNIQAHWVFGTIGNSFTIFAKQIWLSPELAQMLWSWAKTILPILALIQGVKWWRNRVTKKKDWSTDWFWSILTKWLWLGVVLAYFWWDLKALAVWWKWWELTKWIYNRANKDNLYNDNEWYAPKQALQYVFGHMTLQQFHSMLTVDKSWSFIMKPELVTWLSKMPWMSSGAINILRSLLADSSGGLNQMITLWLSWLNIKNMSEFNTVVGANWNMLLRDYAKNIDISNSDMIEKILPGVNPDDKNEIMNHLNTLSETDKDLFLERMQESASFAKTRNDITLVLNDYKRTDAMAALPNASLISAWFAKKADIDALRKQFLYWQAPFASTDKRSNLEAEIAKLFWNDPQMIALMKSSTVIDDVANRSPDLIADYNKTMQREMGKSWKEELFMKNVWWTNAILSTKEVTVGTTTEKRLTFWIPNDAWKYEEWQLDTIWWAAVHCTWAWINAKGEFYLNFPWNSEVKYQKDILNTLVQGAKNNPNPANKWWQLAMTDYNTTVFPNPKPEKYEISKTTNVRPA